MAEQIVLNAANPPRSVAAGATFEVTLFNGSRFFIKDGQRIEHYLSDDDAAQQQQLIEAGLPVYSCRRVYSDGASHV